MAQRNNSKTGTAPQIIGLGGKLRSGKDTIADHLVDEHNWVKLQMSEALNEALYALNPIIGTVTVRPSRAKRGVLAGFALLALAIAWILAIGGHGLAAIVLGLPSFAAVAISFFLVRDAAKEVDVSALRYRELHDQVGYVEAKKDQEVRMLLQRLGTEVGRKIIGENTWTDIVKRRALAHTAEGRNVAITGIRFGNEVSLVHALGGKLVYVERPGVEAPVVGAAGHDSENSVQASDFDILVVNDGTLADLYAKAREVGGVSEPTGA